MANSTPTFTGECFILKRIVDEEDSLITFVAHDDEGDWFFLDDEDWGERDLVLIKPEVLLEMDPSLAELTDLEMNWEAERDSAEDDWTRQAS